MKAILLIDHGSRCKEANEMVHCMAKTDISCGDACRAPQTLPVGA